MDAALAWHEAGVAELASGFAADLQGVQRRQLNPVEVAAGWQQNPELALRWLDWRLAREVRNSLLGKASEGNHCGSTVDTCFQQMTQIRELRRLINGGINAELSIAGLLMDWYGGLNHQ